MGYCHPPLQPLHEDLPPQREAPADDWPPHLRDDAPPSLSGCLGVVLGFAAIVAAMAILQTRIAQEPLPAAREPVVRAEAEGPQ